MDEKGREVSRVTKKQASLPHLLSLDLLAYGYERTASAVSIGRRGQDMLEELSQGSGKELGEVDGLRLALTSLPAT